MTAHPHASLFIHPHISTLLNHLFLHSISILLNLTPSFLSPTHTRQTTMATDGPSWADQWGEGGFGAMADDNTKSNKDTGADKKTAGSGGFGKAKAAAAAGAQKVKNGTSMSIKWVKNKCQKKTSTT